MDLLYKRYANPFSFLSNFKNNFSQTIVNIWNAEQDDKILEMYLHSFSDKSFNEYREELLKSSKIDKKEIVINDEDKKEIIKKSTNILKNFSPSQKGDNDGII